jgi:hypothetical protein
LFAWFVFEIFSKKKKLSGEKQRIGRSYDFSAVISWFAERCDLILLMFDAHKLDISGSFSFSCFL